MPHKDWVHPQKKFNKEKYDFDVYWFAYFTWIYANGSEKDFKTVVRATSSDKAKELLIDKIKREDPKNRVKSLKTYKIHSKFRIPPGNTNQSLSIEAWEAFRNISFPNVTDHLHLIEKPRRPGQTSYFDRRIDAAELARLKKTGFKKGDENWSKLNPVTDADRPPPEERHLYRMKPGGRPGVDWEKIPEEERLAQRIEISNALIKTKGNRAAAARYLGMAKKDFWMLMHYKHPDFDWNKEHPIGGRPKHRSREAIEKAKATFKKNIGNRVHWNKGTTLSPETIKKRSQTCADQRSKKLESLKPKIIEALSNNNNIRSRAAKELKISRNCLWRAMRDITDVDWAKEYPPPQNPTPPHVRPTKK